MNTDGRLMRATLFCVAGLVFMVAGSIAVLALGPVWAKWALLLWWGGGLYMIGSIYSTGANLPAIGEAFDGRVNEILSLVQGAVDKAEEARKAAILARDR